MAPFHHTSFFMAPIFLLITMMHHRLRRACTAMREHTAFGYAKIAVGWYSEVELIIIKATAPDDVPLPERYVFQLVKILSFSPSSLRAFSLGFTRRFGRTRCWRVALKCLALLHRLLRALPDSKSFRSDLRCARQNGLLSLHPCQFRDTSSSASPDFTDFIRSYAGLLDEALDCFFTVDNECPSMENLLEFLPQLQNLIDRAMKCMPSGAAGPSFLIRSTMKQIIRDSILSYKTFQREVTFLLDNLFQLPYRSRIAVMRIYKKAAFQAVELSEFYDSCKAMGFCGSYEYPLIDKIPQIQIQALESFLNEMWQLTETSSSSDSSTPPGTTSDSSTSKENSSGMQLARLETIISTKWEKFEEEEEKPIIQLEEDQEELSWEALLEEAVSVQMPPPPPWDLLTHGVYESRFRYGMQEQMRHQNGWEIQVYDANPFRMFTSNHHEGVAGGYSCSMMDPRRIGNYRDWCQPPYLALLPPSSPCFHAATQGF